MKVKRVGLLSKGLCLVITELNFFLLVFKSGIVGFTVFDFPEYLS